MTLLIHVLSASHRGLSVALRLLTGILLRIAPGYFAPVIDWPKPEGPHPVGTRDMEIPRGSGSRRLMARLWYPADSVAGCQRRAYFGDDPELDAMALGLGGLLPAALVRRLGLIRTWSYEAASIIGGERLPVIVFSHGFTGYVGQNTHLCEHLASHGYLVVSLAHPQGASVVRYPDGDVTQQTRAMAQRLVTPQYLMGMLSLGRTLPPQKRLKVLRQIAQNPLADEAQRWSENISDAIGGLSGPQTLAEVGRVMAMADWSRIGLVGMSLGGSASASAAHTDSRVRVAVNLDGMQQGRTLLDASIRVPILVIHGRQALSADGTSCTQYHYQASGTDDARVVAQRWLVPDANHFDFTDMTVFGHGFVRTMLHLGRIDGTLMLNATAALVGNFLDTHLRNAELLDEQSTIARYPVLTPVHGANNS